MDKELIDSINKVINKYFQANPSTNSAKPKDLMPLLIKEGIFEKDQKSGLPLRKILRDLDENNQLHLIPTVHAERKTTNTFWHFYRSGIKKTTSQIKNKVPKPAKAKAKAGRKNSDEAYVIDLCDEVLSVNASRQHKFDFLKGDAGTKLPVDAYYSSLNLAIEYREKQHTESVKHFDKPDVMTVSGVNRGEQRKIYDQRRRDVLPENGIKLIEISYSDFNFDSQKKIIRNKEFDLTMVKKILKDNNIIK